MFVKFLKDDSGATAIEYGILAAVVGIALVAALGPLNTALAGAFKAVADALNSASGAGADAGAGA